MINTCVTDLNGEFRELGLQDGALLAAVSRVRLRFRLLVVLAVARLVRVLGVHRRRVAVVRQSFLDIA